ncbi:endo alpha-1,4 polygalactosaminidase [Nocardioides dubius]|uniref:Endo alpha-1,4 polygalactosaminidase n=1 Tax=Nocardioides dubius TaxID=317019 RepID=A0ABN1TJL3_9ACTN
MAKTCVALLAVLLLCTSLATATATATAVAPRSAPPVDVDLDYQLGGASTPAENVGIVVRDRKARPAPGVWNVCYVNGFQTQPDEKAFWRKRPGLLLRHRGRPVLDTAWGERLLDIRTPAKRRKLAGIVGRWVEGCARRGFDAVEFDNLDSFSRSRGLIKAGQAKRFARLIVRRAHHAALPAAQKNWAQFNGRKVGFDFAISEECGRYGECGDYVRHYGRAVLAIEYRQRDFEKACAGYGEKLPIVLRDRALAPDGPRSWC